MSRVLLAELARRAPLLPGKDTVAFADIDSTQKRACGRKKQGAAFGHTKIQEQEPAGTGPERADCHDQHAAESVSTARRAGCSGTLVVRADSASCSAAFTSNS